MQNGNTMTIEQIKKEIATMGQFEAAIKMATMEFVNACFDEGLTSEKATQILQSAEGMDAIATRAAKYL